MCRAIYGLDASRTDCGYVVNAGARPVGLILRELRQARTRSASWLSVRPHTEVGSEERIEVTAPEFSRCPRPPGRARQVYPLEGKGPDPIREGQCGHFG